MTHAQDRRRTTWTLSLNYSLVTRTVLLCISIDTIPRPVACNILAKNLLFSIWNELRI